VREKARWIRATLHNYQINKQKLALTPMRWQAGAALYYLGKRIVLGIHGSQAGTYLAGNANAPQDGDILYLALADPADQARVRDATQAWLQQRARAWFGERLHYFLHTRGLKIRRWRLSSATTRWGSCSNDGSIMLSWRLIHFAPAIVDYVIAHELAHLRHMNHSRSFWDEVSQIFPAFESAKHALRRHASTYLPEH
jgi:predicted metal-dependent hydrolase